MPHEPGVANAKQRAGNTCAPPMRPFSGAYGSTLPIASVGHTCRHRSQNVQLPARKSSAGVRTANTPASMPRGYSTSVGHTLMQRSHRMQRAMNSASSAAPGGRSASQEAAQGRAAAPMPAPTASAAAPRTNARRLGFAGFIAHPFTRQAAAIRRTRRSAHRTPAQAHLGRPSTYPYRTWSSHTLPPLPEAARSN